MIAQLFGLQEKQEKLALKKFGKDWTCLLCIELTPEDHRKKQFHYFDTILHEEGLRKVY